MSCVSVSALLVARLDAPGGRVPLLARVSYDDEDPYVVQAAFLDGPTVLARWNFDRQMLAEGLHRPVGEGDVAFSPHRAAGGDELRVALRRPGAEGQGSADAVLFVEARALTGFLEQTYAVTGAGEEFLDLDKLLDELLAR
ncbi:MULTISPECIES: SsgA family sporulation/cell division regulator [unclassified Streptomyces]|uniref:SsgA family sporulation/cell division regulator n=1 Tax=unclassified Streptomyces TaxID=2593676 RepID=UPI002DD7A366|nr:SsgA family sporulation/cell division regulator [Streptomyces sp. NBC_01294]WRZ60985.1 SsgA family sporulation/cell division regulator [Streptomyces sp. NBC_01294]